MNELKIEHIDWNQAKAFLATARYGSLTRAAHMLGLTQPTLGRQVSGFEASLGMLLFDRVGRSLVLTEQGKTLARLLAGMEVAADAAVLFALGQQEDIEGAVCITASDVLSAYVLPDVIVELRKRAPRLCIEVVASNHLQDLVRREADIAIRHSRPTQPELIAVKVSESSAGIYASTSYLEQHGIPGASRDLKHHKFVAFGPAEDMVRYLNHLDFGFVWTEEQFSVVADNGVVGWEFARRGLALAIMADPWAKSNGDMVRLDIDHPQITYPTWIVSHRELHSSKKIRLVFDLLVEMIGKYG